MANTTHIKFRISETYGEVGGILTIPDKPEAFYLFSHGAGAAMNHKFMENASALLSDRGITVLRYNFPYTENKRKRIDSLAVLLETVSSAFLFSKELAGDLPIFAGGKSMGGRMTSQAAANNKLIGLRGLIFFGFPLHPPGKDSVERAEHLYNVKLPMLFIQGTRDKLANFHLLKPVISNLGKTAELYEVDGADHSFHTLKSSGRTDEQVLFEITGKASEWMKKVI